MKQDIPSAEDIMHEHLDPHCFLKSNCYGACIDAMIAFTKLHVTQALKQASRNAYAEESKIGYTWEVNEDSILNAYDLDNIK